MGANQCKEMQKSHGSQCQGEDQLWKNHPKLFPNTSIITESDNKEEVTSFRAPEVTREIFKAAEEQPFHRSLANSVVR